MRLHLAPMATDLRVPAHAHMHTWIQVFTCTHSQTRSNVHRHSPSHPFIQMPAHTHHTVPILGQEGDVLGQGQSLACVWH